MTQSWESFRSARSKWLFPGERRKVYLATLPPSPTDLENCLNANATTPPAVISMNSTATMQSSVQLNNGSMPSNGTATAPEDLLNDIFLPVLTFLGTTLLILLSLVVALGLAVGISLTGHWMLSGSNIDATGIATICLFVLMLVSGLAAQINHKPESFFEYNTQNWQVLYNYLMVGCIALACIGAVRLVVIMGWKCKKAALDTFRSTPTAAQGLDDDIEIGTYILVTKSSTKDTQAPPPRSKRKPLDTRLLLIAILALASSATLLYYGSWSPSGSPDQDFQTVKDIGRFLTRALAFLIVTALVCLSAELTTALISSTVHGHWSGWKRWRQALFSDTRSAVTDFLLPPGAPLLLGILLQLFFWAFVGIFSEWAVEWVLIQLLFSVSVLESGILAFVAIGKCLYLLKNVGVMARSLAEGIA